MEVAADNRLSPAILDQKRLLTTGCHQPFLLKTAADNRDPGLLQLWQYLPAWTTADQLWDLDMIDLGCWSLECNGADILLDYITNDKSHFLLICRC